MTQEEKAKAYDEALERAKNLYPGVHKGCKEVIENVFPELNESEDERIRKELIGALMWQRDNLKAQGPHDNKLILPGFTMEVGDILSWLEKQKEQNLIMANSPQLKEQKPADQPFEEWLDEWYQGSKELGGDVVMSEKEFKNWSRGIRNMFEQKPDEVEIPTNLDLEKEIDKTVNECTDGYNFDWDKFAQHFYELGRNSKPAEWSEEDSIGWDEAFACVTRAEKSAKNEEELQNAVTAEKWLKEIKFKYYVHPVKREWSKEDEDMINRIVERIEAEIQYGDALTRAYGNEEIDWLKSLKNRGNFPKSNTNIGKEGNAPVIGEKPEGTYRELTQAESNFLNTVEVKEG